MLKVFVDKASEMVKNKLISDSESSILFGALIVISNEMKNYQEQKNFIGYLLNEHIKIWQSQPVTEVLNSDILLLKALGIIEETDPKTKEALKNVLENIQSCLEVFFSATKRMQCDPKKQGYLCEDGIYNYPISSFIPEFFPNVLGLIRTINSFYRPEVVQNIPIERRECLKCSSYENVILMSEGMKESGNEEISHISNKLKFLKVQMFVFFIHTKDMEPLATLLNLQMRNFGRMKTC
jgi:hypothetical protein